MTTYNVVIDEGTLRIEQSVEKIDITMYYNPSTLPSTPTTSSILPMPSIPPTEPSLASLPTATNQSYPPSAFKSITTTPSYTPSTFTPTRK